MASDAYRPAVEVVALLASAGGLEALSIVLRDLPAEFPTAIVVQQHLGHTSVLPTILARRTRQRVCWALDGQLVMPGRVVVCPPGMHLELMPDGSCCLRKIEGHLERRFDVLMASIASSYGARGLAAVLSGSGRDGSEGTVAMKRVGAVVIAQSPETAEYPSMPMAAAEAGADLVLPVYEIGLDDTVIPPELSVPATKSHIVVVDDNADMRAYLKRLLGAHWTVSVQPDAAGALAVLRKRSVDLVLADVMMPGVDGFALLHAIRSDPALKSTLVVLVTARAGEGSAVDGLLAGADDYVVKPFAARELVARVGAQLELSRVRAQTARVDKFRMAVVEALRVLDDPEEIDRMLTEMLRDHLHCDDVVFCAEAGSGPAGPNAAVSAAVSTMVIPDVNVDAGLSDAARARYAAAGVAAVVDAPVVRDGRVVGAVEVRNAAPRQWSEDEVHLIEETADRTWEAVERARAVRDVRASEALLRKAVEIKTVGVLFFRPDGQIIAANDAFALMSGYRADELTASVHVGELTGDESRAVPAAVLRRLSETGSAAPYTKEMVRKDGTRWWALCSPMVLDGSGDSAECVEYVIDTTAERGLNARLEEQFRALVRAVGQTVWTTDAKGIVVDDSPSWREFIGQSVDERLGSGWMDAVHPADRDDADRQWAAAVKSGTPVDTQFRLRHAASGGWHRMRIRAIPLHLPDGTVQGWLGMNTDLESAGHAAEN